MQQKNTTNLETLGLTAGAVLLAGTGFLLARSTAFSGSSGVSVSLVLTLLWLGLFFVSMKRDQWAPLLASTVYWLIGSLIRLYLSNLLEGEGRTVSKTLENLSQFVAGPLTGFAALGEEAVMIVMATITLLAMVALIVVLDRNRPKTDDPGSDLYL